ncbi:MAG: hypothetical protein NUW37_16545 [Planctomycetes bacterium]|nr:hypothetical protein [Planctomycetota bacterium]
MTYLTPKEFEYFIKLDVPEQEMYLMKRSLNRFVGQVENKGDSQKEKGNKNDEELAEELEDILEDYGRNRSQETLDKIIRKFNELFPSTDIRGAGVDPLELPVWAEFSKLLNCGIEIEVTIVEGQPFISIALHSDDKLSADSIEHMIQFMAIWMIAHEYFLFQMREGRRGPASLDDLVKAFQSALKEFGFGSILRSTDSDGIDGDWGPRTSSAWTELKKLSLPEIIRRRDEFEESQSASGEDEDESEQEAVPLHPQSDRTGSATSDIDEEVDIAEDEDCPSIITREDLERFNTPENIRRLATIIMSEASVGNSIERASVGFLALNRSKRNGQNPISYQGLAHNQAPTQEMLDLARKILSGQVNDPSCGATHFYSPRGMPQEGEPTEGSDVGGGLEQTPGLGQRNYRPGWSVDPDFPRVNIAGVRERFYKFYRKSGTGRVR